MKSKIHEHRKNTIKLVSKKLLLLAVMLFALISCETPDNNDNNVTTTPTGHVYIVGNNDDGAFVVKDGVLSNIPINDYWVSDVYVVGNDVYTCGKYITGGGVIYTKNGNVTVLDATSEEVGKIFVDGNDVYVTGTVNNQAVYWKNGVVNILTSGATFNSAANSISVNNGIVSVSGSRYNSTTGLIHTVYWKNNVETDLGDTPLEGYGDAFFATNGDVYFPMNKNVLISTGGGGGHSSSNYRNDGYIVKNGVRTLMQTDGRVNDVFVSGNDVYACGTKTVLINDLIYGTNAVVWKNGTAVFTSTNYAAFDSMFVSNNNTFAIGWAGVSTSNPAIFSFYSATLINNVHQTQTSLGVSTNYKAIFVTQ